MRLTNTQEPMEVRERTKEREREREREREAYTVLVPI